MNNIRGGLADKCWILRLYYEDCAGDTVHLLHCVPKVGVEMMNSLPTVNPMFMSIASMDSDDEALVAAQARVLELYSQRFETAAVRSAITFHTFACASV